MKSFAESRSIWANLIIALLVKFWPGAADWVSHNPEVFALGASLLNILLRFVTKTPISLTKAPGALFLAILLLSGCATQYQKIDPGIFAKRNLEVLIDGVSYEGVGVIPERPSYELIVQPKGESAILITKTCHRMNTYEKSKGGWFSSGKYRITHVPVQGLETGRTCALQLDSFDSANGQHSWSFFMPADKSYQLPFELTCNGVVSSLVGTGICQSHHGLIQRFKVSVPVMIWPPAPSNCEMPRKVGAYYEVGLSPDVCLYQFDDQTGRRARLTTLGYSGALVEKGQ